jgi:hypothetical protein
MREAYPRLPISEAMRARRSGRTTCTFSAGMPFRVRGLLEFDVSPELDKVILDGTIHVQGFERWSGPSEVALVPVASHIDRTRRAMLCPGCGRKCGVLSWVGAWCCRKCDGLLDRGQLVGRETLWAEELQQLEKVVAAGRRKGQRQESFDRLVGKAAWLRELLGDCRPRQAAREHCATVDTEWISIDEKRQRPDLDDLDIPSELAAEAARAATRERVQEQSDAGTNSSTALAAEPASVRHRPFEMHSKLREDRDEIDVEEM